MVSSRLGSAAVGLIVALAIVGVAWFVGGRAGFDTIGRGGINETLLPKVGDVAPDFEASDVFGNRVRLSQLRGKPVWLMFWGSWCPPCRAEFPDLVRAYDQLAPEGVRMVAVSLREPTVNAAAYAAENNAKFLVLGDPDQRDTGAAYPILNFPTHIFIDADGVIRSIVLQPMSEQQALDQGRALLSAPSSSRPIPSS